MNIFILDKDPIQAAKYSCDAHVIKMILESAQMLSSNQIPLSSKSCSEVQHQFYKKTHYNHPCTVWVRQSVQNYDWLVKHAYGLCREFTNRYRYNVHKSQRVIELCDRVRPPLPNVGLTPFAQAMPDEYKNDDAVEAYRSYYIGEKNSIAVWKNSPIPPWFIRHP